MLTCFIVDDERPAIKVLENYIKRIPMLNLKGCETNPLMAIDKINGSQIDLIFLDIQMDEMNGLEVPKHIHGNPKIVFCTAYSQFAVSSYEVEAADYLLKPISFDRFEKAVYRVLKQMNERAQNVETETRNDYVFLRTENRGKMIKIEFSEIDFIEGRSNYVAFHIAGKTILTYSTLQELLEILPAKNFARVHKSYIVSIRKIMSIENNEIRLKNSKNIIPLSIHYRDSFLEHIQ